MRRYSPTRNIATTGSVNEFVRSSARVLGLHRVNDRWFLFARTRSGRRDDIDLALIDRAIMLNAEHDMVRWLFVRSDQTRRERRIEAQV